MDRIELRKITFRRFRASLGGVVRGLLCVALVTPPAACAAKPKPRHPAVKPTVPAMNARQRVLHTLNRFTFGPTPGEEALVQRMGVDAWFAEQLHPNSIPDGLLEARLASFPAMQLTQAQLIQRFPSPGMLRQYSNGKLEPPTDPLERAIYADAAFSYEEKKAAKTPEMVAQPSGAVGAEKTVGKVQEAGPTAPPPSQPATGTADEASARAILALPPEARMGRLLAMTPEAMQSLRSALKGNGEQQLTAGMTPAQKEEVVAMQAPLRVVGAEALATRLLRDVYSERQLQAVMTDFWLNHFNVYDRKSQEEPYLLPAYEQGTILPHALGRFEDLLVATAQSPAMLMYLDNWTSVGPDSRAAERPTPPVVGNAASVRPAGKRQAKGINENYARELMELHTLGVNGGYTQDDVIEVAKCFTGWTLETPAKGGGFSFNPNRHQPGPKTVLGHVIPEGGEDEGLAVLHLLATSLQTAHFLSLQLAERFVSDTPPPALVDAMTKAYLQHDGDIASVLLAMFHAPQFWSTTVYRAKVKTPLEFVASALRAGDADVTNPAPLLSAMNRLGMPLYGMQTPNGYSWQAESWVSTNALVTRMNFALTLSGNHLAGTRLDWTGALPAAPVPGGSPEALEPALEMAILGEPAGPRTRAAVLSQGTDAGTEVVAAQSFKAVPVKAATGPGSGIAVATVSSKAAHSAGVSAGGTPVTTMAGLLLGSPDFQHR